MIIYPVASMDVVAWTDAMAYLLGGTPETYRLDDPAKWKDWAYNLLGDTDFTGQNAPDPGPFENWREWAERLYSTVELTG